MLVENRRQHETDKRFDANEENSRFSNRLFVRLSAKDKSFTKVDFKYSVFDACYLRGCHFDSCDFTGCRFVNSNLHGSRFSGCKFEYATFEKTSIDADILDTECPGHENLKARFARTLRTNYQQLGDAAGANKAIRVELQATEIHLHKAWRSNEAYYRKKYQGLRRAKSFIEWVEFKALDFIWGNGESALKLCRSIALVIGAMAMYDLVTFGDPLRFHSYGGAIARAIEIFLGVLAPETHSRGFLATATLLRLIAIGFFLSILVKRFNRR
jgi:hypothetical protein